jgi:hypothetical protein
LPKLEIFICFFSDDRQVCEDYEYTTTLESSGDEKEAEIAKRKQKKKKYTDFVTGN